MHPNSKEFVQCEWQPKDRDRALCNYCGLDEENGDLSGVLVPQEIIQPEPMPIITIEEHLTSPWEDVEARI